MPIEKKELERFGLIMLVDAEKYSFIEAFHHWKAKTLLVYSDGTHSHALYERAPFKPEWKRTHLEKDQTLEILNTRTFVLGRLPKEGIEITEKLIEENEKVLLPKTLTCLAGNIVMEREFGEDHEIRRGTKHFAPHAKVYCSHAHWGDKNPRWMVTGKPRKGHQLITVIIDSKCVENLRPEIVYSPSKIEKLWRDGNYFDSKEDVQSFIDDINEYRELCMKREQPEITSSAEEAEDQETP